MNYVQRMELIRNNLLKSKKVNSYDRSQEGESETIAHGLLDIEESLSKISALIHKLELTNVTEDEVDDVLLDVGEEIRHVLYHIKDMKFYSYIYESDGDSSNSTK